MQVPGGPLRPNSGRFAGNDASDGGNVVQMPGPRPSEANLLMALAEMHRQGSFDPKKMVEDAR
jgi:hypothetical protein